MSQNILPQGSQRNFNACKKTKFMKLSRYFLFVFLSLHFSVVSAKENKDLMKANFYYAHYAFYEAIPYFEKIAGQLNDPVIFSQLADCYSITNNLQKASDVYSKAFRP